MAEEQKDQDRGWADKSLALIPDTVIKTHSVEDCFLITVKDWQALKQED